MTYLIKNPSSKNVNMIYCHSNIAEWTPGNGTFVYPLNVMQKSNTSNISINTSTYEINLQNKRYLCIFKLYGGMQGSSGVVRCKMLINNLSIENISSYNDNVAIASGQTGLDYTVAEFIANQNDKLKIQLICSGATSNVFYGIGGGFVGVTILYILEYDI